MNSAKIVGGDIALVRGGDIATVGGRERLGQMLYCWLMEPLGTNPYDPSFGSSLHSMIGGTHSASEIESEIMRVVKNYMSSQAQLISEYILDPDAYVPIFQPSEIIRSIDDITVTQNGAGYSFRVSITTMDNNVFVFTQSV